MIWIIILVIIAVIIISFASSLNKDTKELKLIKLDEKFGVIVAILNKNLLDSHGQINNIDERAFNLYYKNKIIQFTYGTGNLNIIYRHNLLGEEIVCERLFDNLRDATFKKQELVAQEFLNYVERKIFAYNALNKTDLEVEKRNDEITKFKLSSIFYDFCFSKEIAKGFLEENEMRKNIVTGMYLSIMDNEYISEKIFKNFAKHKYNLELSETNVNEYCVDGFEFKLRARRLQMLQPTSYVELVSHNLDNVKNEYGDNVLIAKDYIIYCNYDEPKALFVFIKDNDLNKYFIRRVYESGTSEKIASLDDHKSVMSFIENYTTVNKI